MSSTNTNKQPIFIDRPLFDHALLTTQIAGNSAARTFNVQGGQAPQLLVDMDADLGDDDNSGGVIDSLLLTRMGEVETPPNYTVDTSTSGTAIILTSGDIVFVRQSVVDPPTNLPSGIGYYTYTGATTLTGVNTSLLYSGGTATGFLYEDRFKYSQGIVTAAFYHTRGTTNPIPASGDYEFIFSVTLVSGEASVDATPEMPQLSAPVPAAGNSAGMESGTPIRARGIYLEKGDRLYVGIYPTQENLLGYAAGLNVTAQGGFF